MNEQQKNAAKEYERQGYNPRQAERLAKRTFPTAQQRGLAAARAAKAKKRAQSKGTGAGSSNAVTATPSSDAGPTSPKTPKQYHTPTGAAKIAASSHTTNMMRWARVRALGLRNLKELAAYDAARKVLHSE